MVYMITYDKLFELLKRRGLTSRYFLQQHGIHPNTISKLQKNGRVNTDTINTLCAILGVQPGDILDYIPDGETPNS